MQKQNCTEYYLQEVLLEAFVWYNHDLNISLLDKLNTISVIGLAQFSPITWFASAYIE